MIVIYDWLTKGNDEYELDGAEDEQTGVENDDQGGLTSRRWQHHPKAKTMYVIKVMTAFGVW